MKIDYRLVAVAVLVVLAVVALAFYKPIEIAEEIPEEVPEEIPTVPEEKPEVPVVKTGEVVVALKDVKQKVERIGTVTELYITVSSIDVHAAEAENETWLNVFNGSKTLDLIQYTDVRAIVGEKELAAGKYTQIRLTVDSASIKIYYREGGIYNRTYDMVVPSKKLKLNHPFEIEADKATVLTLDFDVPQSVTKTDQGYTLKPVIGVTEEKLTKGQRPTNTTAV